MKDAYLTVAVNRSQRRFLQFIWGGVRYEFVSLPFGLGPAPRLFTKILRPVAAHLRRLGLRLIFYLDDILLLGCSKAEATEAVTVVANLLTDLGFVINEAKSIMEPSQKLEYIGLIIDTVTMSFVLQERTREKLVALAGSLRKESYPVIGQIAAFNGLANWAARAVRFAGAHVRGLQAFYIRHVTKDLAKRYALSADAKADLHWWMERPRWREGRSLEASFPSLTLWLDASLSGWGAVCDGITTSGPWTREEAGDHINLLELRAVFYGLRCFASTLSDAAIEVYVDNSTVVSYVNKQGGLKSAPLCALALEISAWCETRSIDLHAIFLPGVANVLVDAESRRPLTSGDWRLSRTAFAKIQALWPIYVDLFAAAWNAQLPKFVSRLPQPESWGTEAMTMDWSRLQGYLFPPFNMVGRCLAKLFREQASAVLVSPLWPSQAWFPQLLTLTCEEPRILLHGPDLLTSPLGDRHQLIASHTLRLVAWRLSGDVSIVKAFRHRLRSSSCPQPGRILTPPINRRGATGFIGAVGGT